MGNCSGVSLQNKAQIDLILIRIYELEIQVKNLKARLKQPPLEKFVYSQGVENVV